MSIQFRRAPLSALIPILVITFTGCPTRVAELESPSVNPAAAAEKAMETYDKDNDDALAKTELEAVPGLARVVARYDADRDKKVSQKELQDRLQKFVDSKLGLMAYSCVVLYNGRPLPEASVEFVPEPFLAGPIKTAIGMTDEAGRAEMHLDAADALPGAPAGIGIQYGIYKIKVTHNTLSLPEKYNTATELGLEVSPIDLTDASSTTVELKGR